MNISTNQTFVNDIERKEKKNVNVFDTLYNLVAIFWSHTTSLKLGSGYHPTNKNHDEEPPKSHKLIMLDLSIPWVHE